MRIRELTSTVLPKSMVDCEVFGSYHRKIQADGTHLLSFKHIVWETFRLD